MTPCLPKVGKISFYISLVWTPCIMHRCVISTMFGWCFWFLKKIFFFQTTVGPPPSPRSFAFLTPVLYLVDPLRLVLRISRSSFLTRRAPRPVLRISHSGSLTRRSPSAGPSHFPLRFFNPSIPPGRSFAFPTPVL
jgi:hypothetical protein